MNTKEEGREKYYKEVYSRSKPKWLFSQVASCKSPFTILLGDFD
jgi:hypothetical protein